MRREQAPFLPYDKFVDITSTFPDGRTFSFQILWDGQKGTCSKCGCEIGWGLSRKKKWIPFELSLNGDTHYDHCQPPSQKQLREDDDRRMDARVDSDEGDDFL